MNFTTDTSVNAKLVIFVIIMQFVSSKTSFQLVTITKDMMLTLNLASVLLVLCLLMEFVLIFPHVLPYLTSMELNASAKVDTSLKETLVFQPKKSSPLAQLMPSSTVLPVLANKTSMKLLEDLAVNVPKVQNGMV